MKTKTQKEKREVSYLLFHITLHGVKAEDGIKRPVWTNKLSLNDLLSA